jgi:two-component system, OmpR family, response regulator RegX3
MLPDGSGIDLCRELHTTSDVPVIMVSARNEEVDVVLGLEFGAADYVTKPYRLRELVARMRAVLRRHEGVVSDEVVVVGEIRIDPTRRTVACRDQTVELSRKEFDLLMLLASRLGHVVTREECLDALWWGQDLADTRTLDTHVKRLRHKIEVDPASPAHLKTIRGVGFRLDR